MSKIKIVYKNIEDLKLNENNPRKNDKAVGVVAKSISKYGFKNPIIINKNNVVFCGNTRLKASIELGLKEVPCIVVNDLTPQQLREFALVDNKTSEFAEWDIELLQLELENLADFDFESFGFSLDFGGYDLYVEDTKEEKDTEFEFFSKDEIKADIIFNWQKYKDIKDYIKNIIDIPTAKYQYNRLCQGYNDGYNISLLFNPHRLDTETIKSKSIFYAINNLDKYKEQFARYVVEVQNKVVPTSQYYKYIGIGSGGIQYVNEFPPYLARDIYKKYCKDGYKILNPCAGWGGRIIGLSSCRFNNIEYIETDPCIKTYNGLLEIKKFLKLNDNYKQYNLPFEELNVEENYFDFVFTSPPYFDTEHYSNEETQSYKNKKNYNDWKNNFLYVMLDKIYFCLKKNRSCLLNVGKVRYPIDTDIIDYMKEKYNINCVRIKDFKYGGDGIGARTDENNEGEPFIMFTKE